MQNLPTVIRQAVKFVLVGGLNTLIDLGVLNLLIFITGIASGSGYSIFKGISFTVAVINSYFLNKLWTFKGTGRKFLQFFIVSLIGFGINVGAASFIVNVIGAPVGMPASLWANIGAVSAVFITLFFNFIGSKYIVFKK